MVESFLMGLLFVIYMFLNNKKPSKDDQPNGSIEQPKKSSLDKHTLKQLGLVATIVLSIKMTYFFDKESSLNFQTDETLKGYKQMVSTDLGFKIAFGLLGIVVISSVENHYVNLKY